MIFGLLGINTGKYVPMAVEDLKKNAMVAHLIDVLDHKEDIGHYGRLVFTRVAQHFLSEYEVVAELAKDKDFSEEQARSLYLSRAERPLALATGM